jgi:hypothetical protein
MLCLISGAIAGTAILIFCPLLPFRMEFFNRDIVLFTFFCFAAVFTLIYSMSLLFLLSLWIRKTKKLFINKSFSLFLTGLFYSIIYLYITEYAVPDIDILAEVLFFGFYPVLSLTLTFLTVYLIYKVLPNKLCLSKKNDVININKKIER